MSRPIKDAFKQSLIYGLGNVGMSLLSLVLIPIYTRYLVPAEYGVLALVLLYHAVMNRFYDLGLTNSVGRFYFDYREEEDEGPLGRMLGTTQTFLLIHGLILSIAGWLLAPWLAEIIAGSREHTLLFRVTTTTLFVEALTIPALTLLRMEERASTWVTIQFGRVAGALVLNIWFVVFMGLGVLGILLSYVITAVVVLAVCAVLIAPRVVLGMDREVLKRMLGFGLPFLPVLLGVLVIDVSDRYLLQYFRGEEEVGIYTLGYKFGQALLMGVTAFNLGWTPVRYRVYGQPEAKDVYRRVGTLYWTGATVAIVFFATLGDEVVRIASAPAYHGASVVIPWITFAYALYGMHLIMTVGMGVTKKTAALPFIVVTAAVVNVGLNIRFIPEFGMVAAAASTVAAYLLTVAGTVVFSNRVYPIAYDWPRLLSLSLGAVAMVVADLRVQPEGLAPGIALGLALTAVFAGFTVMIGAVRTSEIAAARRWVALRMGKGA